jgi:hypothetical protein
MFCVCFGEYCSCGNEDLKDQEQFKFYSNDEVRENTLCCQCESQPVKALYSNNGCVRRVRKSTKRDYKLRHVYPLGTTRLPVDGSSRNLVIKYFSKIC